MSRLPRVPIFVLVTDQVKELAIEREADHNPSKGVARDVAERSSASEFAHWARVWGDAAKLVRLRKVLLPAKVGACHLSFLDALAMIEAGNSVGDNGGNAELCPLREGVSQDERADAGQAGMGFGVESVPGRIHPLRLLFFDESHYEAVQSPHCASSNVLLYAQFEECGDDDFGVVEGVDVEGVRSGDESCSVPVGKHRQPQASSNLCNPFFGRN